MTIQMDNEGNFLLMVVLNSLHLILLLALIHNESILVETILAMNPTQQICSGSSLYASSSLIVG